MKRKQYYVLFLLYVVVVAFVLYLNGVFTGEWEASVNLIINVGFLLMIESPRQRNTLQPIPSQRSKL